MLLEKNTGGEIAFDARNKDMFFTSFLNLKELKSANLKQKLLQGSSVKSENFVNNTFGNLDFSGLKYMTSMSAAAA